MPPQRSVEELINQGVVNLDKPAGPTSHQVVAWVKDILEIEKAGHGGTLDPKVTGVLPIALNNSTKALQSLLHGPKEYVCIMRMHRDVNEERLREVMKEFVGKIYQLPPIRAAVKRELRVREIYCLDVLEIEGRRVLFKVRCESGTYLRTLVKDVGNALGIGANMEELRRIKSCSFDEESAVTLHDLKDAYFFWKENGEEEFLRKMILPMESLLEHLPKVIIKDTAVDALCHGADLAITGVKSMDTNIRRNGVIAVLTLKGEGVALGRALYNSDEMVAKEKGIVVNVERVLMGPGVYPSMWKRSRS